MDLDRFLKAMLSLMISHKYLKYAIITKNRKQSRLVHDKLLSLINEIPEWLKPCVDSDVVKLFAIGNGSSVSISMSPRHLQGQTIECVGVIVSDNKDPVPDAIFNFVFTDKVRKIVLPVQP